MPPARILIVEDEPIIAADLADRLAEAGHAPLPPVARGEDALEVVHHDPPDLILMDVNLAGALDGVATALAIAEITPVPLIFLTSNSDEPTFRRARAARPRAFLSKPYRGRDLRHAVDLALEDRPARDRAPSPTSAPAAPPIPAGESAARDHDRLFVRVKDQLVRLLLDDILCVSADDYYCRVVTAEREYLVTKTLKKFSALLPEEQFVRCHRSHVVNLRRITRIGEIFVFLGEHHVPVSKAKRAELLARIQT